MRNFKPIGRPQVQSAITSFLAAGGEIQKLPEEVIPKRTLIGAQSLDKVLINLTGREDLR